MVDIKDISGNPRFSTPINEGSKRKFLLMKEDYILLTFSLSEPVYFKLGDYVDNELGIFELVDLYKPTYNTTTGAYDYELRLDAYYWKWKNKKFFYTPETTGREAAWNLTATLDTHLKVFLDNLKALGYKFRDLDFTWDIDSTVKNTSKLVSYDNVNLIDALTQMAETWECEWWIENHKICFGRCEYSSPVDFKAGDLTDTENVNVNSMTRSDSQTTYATRIYAFGSTRNIPSSYRKELIFDVKEVNGRNISDTSRPLKINYFPPRVTYKEDYTASSNEGSGPFTPSHTEWTLDKALASSAKGGSYKVVSEGISINISTAVPQIGNRALLPAGDYILKASYIYNVSGESKEVIIGNQTVSLAQNQQYEIVSKIQVSDTLVIDKNSSDLKVRVYVHVPAPASSELLSTFQAYVTYDINLYGGSSATTSVTFLSGANVGRTFDAVYNPDLLTGDAANVIQLPEGVTASLGNRYTIDNIIKGKVPDNYFSKDDKEMTLNGVVQKRLMLPEGISYVDAYKYSPTGERINIGDENYDDPDNVEMPEEEAIEEIVTFEDEYPKYTGSIFSVSHEEKEEEDDDGNKTGNKYPIYTFRDNSLKNFTKDFLLEELHLIFQTGKLAGLDFALTLKESDNTGTAFEIVRNEDYGRALPDDVLFPQAAHKEEDKDVPADTYILYGFDTAFISEQMLPDSGQALLEKAQDYVKKSMIDPSTYDCEMDADFIYNNGNIREYEVGAKVNLINKAFFPEGRQSRIIGFEWPLDIPYDHPVYTVGETAAYSRIGEIESKIDSLTYKGQTYSGSALGGGGTSVYVIGVNDKTLPSDRNVFSSKKSLATFLNKTTPDTASEIITFLKGLISEGGIEVGGFIDSLISGTGIGLFPDGKIQASSMELRSSLTVLELIFNRLSAQEGDTSFTESGVIESIELLGDGTYRLPLRKRHTTDFTAFDWNDIIYGSVNDLATGGGNYRTSWMRVVGVNTVDNYIEAVLYPDSEVPGGKNYPPEPLMIITRRGNTSDEDRQSYWYISSYEKCICMLDGVTKPILEENNYSILIGKMKRLSLFDNLPINYRQSYVYCRGLIRQDDIRIDVTGKPVYEFVNRGIWSLSVATSEEPYLFESKNPITGVNETSTVYQRGAKWQCLKSRTLLEPKWNSTDWAFLEGNGEFSIDFQSSKGFSFFYGLIDTVIEARFYHGTTDITEDVMSTSGTVITWNRDTGIAAEDNAWSPTFVDGKKNKIHLISSDMGSQWLNARSVTFKITAVIPLGEENYLRESEELQFNL